MAEGFTDKGIPMARGPQHKTMLKFFPFGGRRKSALQDQDKKGFIYADRYDSWLLVAILLLVILNISDSLLTLNLIQHGATEENPVMVYFLNFGVGPFMIAKLILTCSAILIFLAFQNYLFRPLRIHMKVIISTSLTIFAVVISWQIFLNYFIN